MFCSPIGPAKSAAHRLRFAHGIFACGLALIFRNPRAHPVPRYCPLARQHILERIPACFGSPLERAEIHVHHTEAFFIAQRPFVIVQE